MTDQEREIQRVISYIRSCRDAGIDTTITIDKSRNHFILNALEELQQYRAIGTVKEFRNCMDILNKAETDELAKIIDEWLLYHKIGTAEECREARERQREKKANKEDVQPYFRKHYANTYSCPLCHKKLAYHKQKFCQDCGQSILWECDSE